MRVLLDPIDVVDDVGHRGVIAVAAERVGAQRLAEQLLASACLPQLAPVLASAFALSVAFLLAGVSAASSARDRWLDASGCDA